MQVGSSWFDSSIEHAMHGSPALRAQIVATCWLALTIRMLLVSIQRDPRLIAALLVLVFTAPFAVGDVHIIMDSLSPIYSATASVRLSRYRFFSPNTCCSCYACYAYLPLARKELMGEGNYSFVRIACIVRSLKFALNTFPRIA